MSLKIHFLESHLDFFRKSRRSQWRTRWKISPRHYGYGKAVPRHVDHKYVGRLLLDNEEECTWRQIPAKIIGLYILEESFCLFHEHVKYCFAHLNSSVYLKICLIEKYRIISELSIQITDQFVYWSSWDKKKKLILLTSVIVTAMLHGFVRNSKAARS
jgi:hypothetical protein